MRRQVPVQDLVFRHLFPKPKANADPSSWRNFVHQFLVKEVRQEAMIFYGDSVCLAQRFPGLDYTSKIHRQRLSRFLYHAKLFEAFEDLDLTDHEILSLCTWEGTLHARRRYEKEHGIIIDDTEGDGILHWNDKAEVARRQVREITLGPLPRTSNRNSHRRSDDRVARDDDTSVRNYRTTRDEITNPRSVDDISDYDSQEDQASDPEMEPDFELGPRGDTHVRVRGNSLIIERPLDHRPQIVPPSPADVDPNGFTFNDSVYPNTLEGRVEALRAMRASRIPELNHSLARNLFMPSTPSRHASTSTSTPTSARRLASTANSTSTTTTPTPLSITHSYTQPRTADPPSTSIAPRSNPTPPPATAAELEDRIRATLRAAIETLSRSASTAAELAAFEALLKEAEEAGALSPGGAAVGSVAVRRLREPDAS